jgi:hypothetical protein
MAYNTLEPIKIDCPVCHIRSEHRFQFETGADHGGDETGRLPTLLQAWRSWAFLCAAAALSPPL